MAKYEVTFSCGHTGTVSLFGKNTDRENKLKWYEEQGLCPECYKAKKRAAQEQEPLTLNVGLDLFDNSGCPFVFAFTGNTMPVKDEIKKLRYRWDYITIGAFSIFNSYTEMTWQTRAENVETEIARVKEVFPDINVKLDITENKLMAYKAMKREADEKLEALRRELEAVEVPEKPDCYPTGRWNGKVYGGAKYGYSIYVDGAKTEITEEEKEQLEAYSFETANYKTKLAKIKESYN